VVLSAAYFNTKYEDMIDWVTTDWLTYVGQYQNVTNVDTYGVELAFTLRPVQSLVVSGAYTYLHTENKETGEPLLRKPKHTFSGYAAYTFKRFTLSMNMVYVGKRPDLDYSTYPWDTENPAFNTYDFNLMVRVVEGLSVFGKITNAFDKEYQELVGYPSPGRRFELGLKYRVK
jgi:vitamin B12 transporter